MSDLAELARGVIFSSDNYVVCAQERIACDLLSGHLLRYGARHARGFQEALGFGAGNLSKGSLDRRCDGAFVQELLASQRVVYPLAAIDCERAPDSVPFLVAITADHDPVVAGAVKCIGRGMTALLIVHHKGF